MMMMVVPIRGRSSINKISLGMWIVMEVVIDYSEASAWTMMHGWFIIDHLLLGVQGVQTVFPSVVIVICIVDVGLRSCSVWTTVGLFMNMIVHDQVVIPVPYS